MRKREKGIEYEKKRLNIILRQTPYGSRRRGMRFI